MAEFNLGEHKIDVPSKWHLATAVVAGPVVERGESFFAPTVALSLQEVAPETTAMELSATLPQLLRNSGLNILPNSKASEKVKLKDGREAVLSEHWLMHPDGTKIRQMHVIFIVGKVAYVVTGSDLGDDTVKYDGKGMRDILFSVKIGNVAL